MAESGIDMVETVERAALLILLGALPLFAGSLEPCFGHFTSTHTRRHARQSLIARLETTA